VSCGVGHRRGLDLVLLWLWHRPAAVAPIGPLAWKLPYAMWEALEKAKRPPHTHTKKEFLHLSESRSWDKHKWIAILVWGDELEGFRRNSWKLSVSGKENVPLASSVVLGWPACLSFFFCEMKGLDSTVWKTTAILCVSMECLRWKHTMAEACNNFQESFPVAINESYCLVLDLFPCQWQEE